MPNFGFHISVMSYNILQKRLLHIGCYWILLLKIIQYLIIHLLRRIQKPLLKKIQYIYCIYWIPETQTTCCWTVCWWRSFATEYAKSSTQCWSQTRRRCGLKRFVLFFVYLQVSRRQIYSFWRAAYKVLLWNKAAWFSYVDTWKSQYCWRNDKEVQPEEGNIAGYDVWWKDSCRPDNRIGIGQWKIAWIAFNNWKGGICISWIWFA